MPEVWQQAVYAQHGRKYEKDGTLKPSWSSGKLLANRIKNKLDGNSYAQLEKHFAKVERALKKSYKAAVSCKRNVTMRVIVVPTLNRKLG